MRDAGLCGLRHRGQLASASKSTACRARASRSRSSPTSRRTTWTTTAPWPPTAAAKRKLFDWEGLQAAVLNVDDRAGRGLGAETAGPGRLDVWTVGLGDGPPARRDVHYTAQGLAFEVIEGRANAPCADRPDRRLQRAQLAGRVGRAARAGPGPGRSHCRLPRRSRRCPAACSASATARELPMVVVDYAHTPTRWTRRSPP